MQDYKNLSHLIPLIFIPVALLLIFLLPKKFNAINFNQIIDKSFVAKFSYYLVQFISLLLNVIISAYTIQRMFFYRYHIIIFIVATILIMVYISNNKEEVIFNSSSILFFISIFLIIIPVFLSTDVKDFTLLKPLYEFKGASFLLMIYFVLDSISIIVTSVDVKSKITKEKLLIPIILMICFMSMDLLNIIVITGDSYLSGSEFLGFYTLFIQDTINYIGNLGLFFLFVIPIVGSFKSGFCLRRIKSGFKLKNNFITNGVISIILILLSYTVVSVFEIWSLCYYLILISTICLVVVYVFISLNRSTEYEIRF